MSDLTEHEKNILGVLITNLDGDGYLRLPLEEPRSWPRPTSRRPSVSLRVLQGFDPAGVGARTLSECLLLQLAQLGQGRLARRRAGP